ncbi:hypothetical protein PMAYCL1PPCAC_27514, partial [Pristionchus mayeri]
EKLDFRKASKFCSDKGSRLPWVQNDDDNGAVAKVMDPKSAAWLDQAVIDGKWRAAVSEPVSFF